MLKEFEQLVKQVLVESKNPRDPVTVSGHPDNWRCVGVGNSAAVFQPKDQPNLSIKVYANTHAQVSSEEAEIYEQLGESPFFPHFYGRGEQFLLIEYRPGRNIYDCLVQGIYIPEQVILDVEAAITYARSRGLNPSDIHIKNILVHKGRGFLVDVSDYRKKGECKRWESLKQAYYEHYLELYTPGLTVPSWILETIRKWYKANEGEGNIVLFAEQAKRMFFG